MLSGKAARDLASEIRARMLANYMKQRASSAMINDISALFDAKAKGVAEQPRFTISHSTIGMLNSESEIDNATSLLRDISQGIDGDLAAILRELLTFLADKNNGLDDQARRLALGLARDLTKQASIPKEERASTASLQTIITRLAEIIKTSAAGSALWLQWGQHLLALLT
jgi:hypothetical protein